MFDILGPIMIDMIRKGTADINTCRLTFKYVIESISVDVLLIVHKKAKENNHISDIQKYEKELQEKKQELLKCKAMRENDESVYDFYQKKIMFLDDIIEELNKLDEYFLKQNKASNTFSFTKRDYSPIFKENNSKILSELERSQRELKKRLKEKVIQNIKKNELLWVNGKDYLLDPTQKLIWNADQKQVSTYPVSDLETKPYSYYPILGFVSELPKAKELQTFSRYSLNPFKTGSGNRIWNENIWRASEDSNVYNINLDNGNEKARNKQSDQPVIWVNRKLTENLDNFVEYCLENNISISSLKLPEKDILEPLYSFKNTQNDVSSIFKNIDFNRCRLPELDERRFTDVNLGLWEFWGNEKLLENTNVRSRNPALDIQSGNIGIDFGTSSTVVAYEDKNGRAKLLRVGVKDFFEEAQSEHYENPTVLEFVNFSHFEKAWKALDYQPLVNWNDVRCSHEAQENFRDNDSNPEVVGSILAKIKQWALREGDDSPIRLTDREGTEHELAHLTLRNPVKGQGLSVGEDYTFDPVELYAWFLGLNINWRSRGIFLKYYMTFPVAYPKDVKEKILASFRRGLLRSLPESLINNAEAISQFSVEERASEPAAYAAVAMKALGIEPPDDDKGLAYAVFDFGGGTTDFDYGYYRWANEAEEAKGIEEVFEHFESAGDKFLGGENLLENLAYLVFKANLDICRSKRISFTKPLDADDFSGSEMLIEKTQAAHTNTLMLMSILRSYWHTGQLNTDTGGIASVNLVNRENESIKCDLRLPKDEMDDYLENRIARGIESFLMGMKNAFGDNVPKEVHVLLAGNSSRSKLVTQAFGLFDEGDFPEGVNDDGCVEADARAARTDTLLAKIFSDTTEPKLIAYKPLEADEKDDAKPTAKTGVALGILRLDPASGVKVINHTESHTGEAPFAHFVGKIRRGKFQLGLKRNETYQQWAEIGVVSEGNSFNLYHTASTLALSGTMPEGHNELYRKSLNFVDSAGLKVFARAISPDVIELCTAETLEQAGSHNLREVNLAK